MRRQEAALPQGRRRAERRAGDAALGRDAHRRSARASPASSRSTRSSCAAGTPRQARRSRRPPRPTSSPIARSASRATSVASALGGGSVTVGDAPVDTQEEADALAKSVRRPARQRLRRGRGRRARRPAPARRRARQGRGRRHALRRRRTRSPRRRTSSAAERGYETRFPISGRSPRTLLELMTPGARRSRGPTALVDRRRDPQRRPGEARPRAREVPGARATTSRAGGRASPRRRPASERGLLMLPRRRRGRRRLRARRRAQAARARLALERQGQARRPGADGRLVRACSPSKDDRASRPRRTITIKARGGSSIDDDGQASSGEGQQDALTVDGKASHHQGRAASVTSRPAAALTLKGARRHRRGGRRRSRSRGSQVHARMRRRRTSSAPASPSRCASTRAAASRSSRDDEDVREAIALILGTAPGERPDAARVRLRHPRLRLRVDRRRTRSAAWTTRSASRSTAGSRASTSSTSTSTLDGAGAGGCVDRASTTGCAPRTTSATSSIPFYLIPAEECDA